MHFHTTPSQHIKELRENLKQHARVPIEAELDILKPMVSLKQWKKTNRTKDDYAVRVARLVWLIWKEIESIWPDFHLHDYCLFFDLEPTDKEFYYIDRDIGEICKYPKTIRLQLETNLFELIENDLYSCVFLQHHASESFVRRKFLWHQDWMLEYPMKERHYEDDFEFFHDNICLGQFSYVTAVLIREWLVRKHKEHHIQMEKHDFQHKISSIIRATNLSDRYVNYLPPTEVQRLHVELANSLCCAILHSTDNQAYLNDALARIVIIKTDYAKEWYDNNWYCSYNDGLVQYLMMNISLQATFGLNLNLKSNLEYYQLFIRHLLINCDDPFQGRVYESASIQFLTAVLCDLGEEDSNLWKRSYNGKILHTLFKHALNSNGIRPEMRNSGRIEAFFTEVIIQSYHHFSLFAKQLQAKQAKFLILPNESRFIAASKLSYYAPAMKHLLNGNMWVKYIRQLDYSSDHGTVRLQNLLIGETCLTNHHIFVIALLQETTLTDMNRLVIHSDQVEANLLVKQQENHRQTYFIVDSHRQNDYSNVLLRSAESNNRCVIS
ncbi:unnamed protein product [Adineta ricciae]|uniref:Uncharacterized protein n=1 Tax=Adineta ricciae TaxID=249248 RepID=A0A814C391_ADIRI|nr:unnamed protein product [Adineta ricciae]CAF1038827.1 unnamed protein product [Adineta ricciae]